MENILVIGNGFDIAHGFNTRYEDFIVAKINFTCAGGSSKVLSNALKAPVESI